MAVQGTVTTRGRCVGQIGHDGSIINSLIVRQWLDVFLIPIPLRTSAVLIRGDMAFDLQMVDWLNLLWVFKGMQMGFEGLAHTPCVFAELGFLSVALTGNLLGLKARLSHTSPNACP